MSQQDLVYEGHQTSAWAIGYAAFAGVALILGGIFQALVGIAALANDDYLVVTQDYAFRFDITTWGWIHLVLGLVVLAAGIGIFSGSVVARTIGVFVAVLSAGVHFMFMPYQPIWSAIVIALDVAIIWALTAHGRDIAERREA
jgi:hypothetical protein